MRTCFLLLVLYLLPLRAEIVDRLLAVVGDRVITWSGALAEVNCQAFLHGQEPRGRIGPDELRPVVSKMIDQILLEQARELSLFSPPDTEETQERLEEIQRRFPDLQAYRKALARYQLSEQELRERLVREASILAFIDYRLRPQVRLDPAQAELYYRDTLLPELLRQQGQQRVSPLSEVRDRVEQILAEQEINRLLEEWLQELRRRARIEMLL